MIDDTGGSHDSADIVRRWRAERPNTPVVVLSAGSDDDLVGDVLSAGATEWLPRELVETDPSLVAERLRRVVEREHALTSVREIYDNVAGVATLHDPESGEMLHANDALCELLGYDRAELQSMQVGEFTAELPGYDHERITRAVASVTEQDGAIELEWPLETADGRIRWTEASLRTVHVGGRELVLSTSVDVTERRRQERRYEQVFDNVNDVISVHDPWAEEMVDVNETMTELTGYSRETLFEMDLGGLGAVGDGLGGEDVYEIQRRVAATGETETVEWSVETAAGERRLLEANLAPATIAGEDRVLALSRDVTERTEYERQLERERDRRSVLFENNPDPVVRVQFEGGEPVIREINPAFEDVFGFTSEEIVGSTVAEAVVPESERTDFEEFRKRAAGGDRVEAVAPRVTATGTREFLFRVIHFDADRDAERDSDAYVWYTDITERKRRERMVRHLHESTAEVQNADTATAVFEAVADAASEVLDLTAPTCWGDPDDKGELTPVATGGGLLGLSDGESEPGVIEPGTPAYDAYLEREMRVVDPETVSDGEPKGEVVIVPLGGHGVVAAAAPGAGRIDDVTLDAARILARHATTALDRVEQDRELRESERRFRLIAEHIDEIVYLATADFSEMLYINPAYEDIYGRPVEELYERPTSFVEAAHPDDRARYEADIERLIDEVAAGDPQAAYEGQYRIQRDGETRWVTVTRFPIENEDGVVDRVVGRVEDITERRRREREYEQIFEMAGDGIVIHDPETGDVVNANRQVAELLGYDREAFVERPLSEFQATDEGVSADDARDMIRESVTEGGQEFEWPLEAADGETVWVRARHELGEIAGEQRVVALLHDITERKRREREYEEIFDGVNDIIAVHDPETGELIDINSTMCELTGYDRERILEMGAEGLLVEDDDADLPPDRVPKIIERVIDGEEISPYEQAIETRDGRRVWLEVNPTRALIGGEERFLAISRDITERKRREREYEQIFDGVTDSITVHDPETAELVDVNDTFCELLGYDRDQILEMGISGYSPGERGYTMDRARELVQAVVESDGPEQTEWAVETSDGETRWLDVKGTTIELGGELRCVALNRDVTERRRTERRLSEVLDRIDEAIFITRAEAITSGSQAPDYVSSGYEDIWGRSLDEISSAHENGFFDTLHPDDADGYRAFVEGIVGDVEAGTTSDSYSHEYRIRRTDGETRWVQSDYYPTAWEGGQTRVVIVSRDVTERKRRERRIASFDDATEDLATADTPTEATRMAVKAAAETLDLPAVGAFLYDDEGGVLRPEALAGELPSEAAAEPIEPGDGALWEGFAAGTVVASDGGDDPTGFLGDRAETELPAGLAELAAWRALSLGNHGTLLVGTPDGSLTSGTVQAAHILAATLEAALNHLEGQRRLAAQEEQLRTQTERAERLDRIARLTQQVEAAITEASSAAEVERAVCERLADTGPYALAWIGGIDAGSDRLAARAIVGAPEGYVESMDLTTASGTADPHPAIDAWRTDRLAVENSLVGEGPADDWRRAGLSAGHQSLCAVPLTYDGITRGVLTIGSESPNAFDERERDVLSQLGATIANALAAIERRRALESDETVELEFRGPGDALSFARAAAAADCRVRLERTAAKQDGPTSLYFGFTGEEEEDVMEIAERRLPGSVDLITSDSSSTLVEAHATDWFGAPIAEYGGVLREAVADPEETTILVEVPRHADVRSFVERLQEVAPSLELTAQRQHQRRNRTPSELSERVRSELTDRQLEVVRTALSAGYFEWPRENDGSEVATRLDITQPTFNKHLRLAERKTFGVLFDADD
ncbi:PAS domain S-box protein [Haloarcula litorea]|uniref:PAS domain S-box protein n=1 Tax=Haloarcula litorea TaxID=3032579 RepID=UPI0023E8C695|nr:PAS domain S-box protein [Halomicroarcula sp. GDY20]